MGWKPADCSPTIAIYYISSYSKEKKGTIYSDENLAVRQYMVLYGMLRTSYSITFSYRPCGGSHCRRNTHSSNNHPESPVPQLSHFH